MNHHSMFQIERVILIPSSFLLLISCRDDDGNVAIDFLDSQGWSLHGLNPILHAAARGYARPPGRVGDTPLRIRFYDVWVGQAHLTSQGVESGKKSEGKAGTADDRSRCFGFDCGVWRQELFCSSSSILAVTSSASGVVRGSKRATTSPFLLSRNLVKFQGISPAKPAFSSSEVSSL